MPNQETIDYVKSEIAKLPDEMAKAPYTSVNNLIHQATDLLSQVNNDMEELSAIGIDNNIRANIEAAIFTLRDYQTVWNDTKTNNEKTREEWNIKYPEAEYLKKELLQTLRFVYDGDKNQLKKIAEITAGDGYDDTIADLKEIAYMGNSNLEIFAPLNYDTSLFNKAQQLGDELIILLGKMNRGTSSDKDVKMNRDKAFYYLRELLSYTRKYGKYAFRNNPDKIALYTEAIYN